MNLIKQKLYGVVFLLISILTVIFATHCGEDCGFALIIGIPMGLALMFTKENLLTETESNIEEEEEEL